MENQIVSFETIKAAFPNEWVLLINPQMEAISVLKGRVLFHHKNKKEVCLYAKKVAKEYPIIKVTYTGKMNHVSKLGLFKVIEEL